MIALIYKLNITNTRRQLLLKYNFLIFLILSHYLIYFLTGVGKTTTAYLVAKELGYDIMELNASDTR